MASSRGWSQPARCAWQALTARSDQNYSHWNEGVQSGRHLPRRKRRAAARLRRSTPPDLCSSAATGRSRSPAGAARRHRKTPSCRRELHWDTAARRCCVELAHCYRGLPAIRFLDQDLSRIPVTVVPARRLTALENERLQAGPGQGVRGAGATEARTDNDGVIAHTGWTRRTSASSTNSKM